MTPKHSKNTCLVGYTALTQIETNQKLKISGGKKGTDNRN